MNILPFSYHVCKVGPFLDHAFLEDWLSYHNQNEVRSFFQEFQTSVSHSFPYVWGIKITKDGQYEYEIYTYNYHPVTHKIYSPSPYPWISNSCTYPITMTSFDYPCKTKHTYIFDEIKNNMIYGHSETNTYTQFHPYNLDASPFHSLFDAKYIYTHDTIPTLFTAFKPKKNYIGVYYDGVPYACIKEALYDIQHTANNYDAAWASISMDFSIKDMTLERVGIYGLL